MDARHHVRLVVGHAAGDDAAVRLGRLERGRRPQVDRVDGLHVVVLVEQELAAPRPFDLGVQRGHAARLERLDAVGVARQPVGEPVARGLDRVAAVVGDAGKRAQLLQLVDEAAAVLLDVRVDGAG